MPSNMFFLDRPPARRERTGERKCLPSVVCVTSVGTSNVPHSLQTWEESWPSRGHVCQTQKHCGADYPRPKLNSMVPSFKYQGLRPQARCELYFFTELKYALFMSKHTASAHMELLQHGQRDRSKVKFAFRGGFDEFDRMCCRGAPWIRP